jgi:hypothetical protein
VWAVREDGKLLHDWVERSSWELFQRLSEKYPPNSRSGARAVPSSSLPGLEAPGEKGARAAMASRELVGSVVSPIHGLQRPEERLVLVAAFRADR